MLGTKLLLMALSSTVGMLLGLFFSNGLKGKRDFYQELSAFIDGILSDLSFKQNGIKAVASGFVLTSKSKMKGLLQEYCDNPQTHIICSFLPKAERQTVEEFFRGLGKSDILTEKSELGGAKQKVSELLEYYKAKCVKLCPMYLKLGLLGGLAVGILML